MRVSLITGVSRGLGAALCDQLYAAGDCVVGIGRSFTAAQREQAGERLVLRQAELSHPETLPAQTELAGLLAGATTAALIHNAAVVTPIGALGALPPAEVSSAVAVNLTAPMLLTNAFLGALPPELPATVLFVSSGAAHRPVAGWSVYGASKRGGEAFFEAVAEQVGDRPVTVASVNPGVMDTGMQQAIREVAAGDDWFPEGDRFLSLHDHGDLPDPANVAAALIAEYLPPADRR